MKAGKKFRTNVREDRVAVKLDFPKGEGRTRQSFKEDADINNIVKRFNTTGQLPAMIRQDAKYGDFSTVTDFREAMDLVMHAQDQFANLPAAVRDRFGNDPARFLEFAMKPESRGEMVKMGLAELDADSKAAVAASAASKAKAKGKPSPSQPDPALGGSGADDA